MAELATRYHLHHNRPPELRKILRELQREAKHAIRLSSDPKYLRAFVERYLSKVETKGKADHFLQLLYNNDVLIRDKTEAYVYLDPDMLEALFSLDVGGRNDLPVFADKDERHDALREMCRLADEADRKKPEPAVAARNAEDNEIIELYSAEIAVLKAKIVELTDQQVDVDRLKAKVQELTGRVTTHVDASRVSNDPHIETLRKEAGLSRERYSTINRLQSQIQTLETSIAQFRRDEAKFEDRLLSLGEERNAKSEESESLRDQLEQIQKDLKKRDRDLVTAKSKLNDSENVRKSMVKEVPRRLERMAYEFNLLIKNVGFSGSVPIADQPAAVPASLVELRNQALAMKAELEEKVEFIMNENGTLSLRIEEIENEIYSSFSEKDVKHIDEIPKAFVIAHPELARLLHDRNSLIAIQEKGGAQPERLAKPLSGINSLLSSIEIVSQGLPEMPEFETMPTGPVKTVPTEQPASIETICESLKVSREFVLLLSLLELAAPAAMRKGVLLKRVANAAVKTGLIPEADLDKLTLADKSLTPIERPLFHMYVQPVPQPFHGYMRTTRHLPWNITHVFTEAQGNAYLDQFDGLTTEALH